MTNGMPQVDRDPTLPDVEKAREIIRGYYPEGKLSVREGKGGAVGWLYVKVDERVFPCDKKKEIETHLHQAGAVSTHSPIRHADVPPSQLPYRANVVWERYYHREEFQK